MSSRNLAIPFIVAGMLVTGTINTVITKMIFNIGKAPGCCGWQSNGVPNDQPHNFAHPWFNTWIMFLGEFLCFIPFILSRPSAKKQDSLVRNTQGPKTENPYSYIFAIPTICDLTASTLGNVALLWVDASIWQMMRGAIIIFGAILSLLVLKKKLYMHHWFGIGLVVIGLFLVGLAGMLKQSATSTSNLFYVGIALVIFAQLIAATQMIIEELLLKERSYEPLNVVFMEGFWGVIITAAVALPVLSLVSASPISPLNYTNAQANPWIDIFSENVPDGVTQMMNRPIFFYENLILLFSIAFYNFFGLSLARYLSTVHRTLIDACRTVSVWAIQVIFFYIDFVGAGEKLQLESLLQLAGFIFLVIGTIVYNEVIKIPGSYYEVPQKKGVN